MKPLFVFMRHPILSIRAMRTGKSFRFATQDFGHFEVEWSIRPDLSVHRETFQRALSLPTVRPQKQADNAEARGSETVITSDRDAGVRMEWSPPHDEHGFPILETSWILETDSNDRRVSRDFDGTRMTKNIELH